MENLEKNNPNLSKVPKGNQFSLPKDYFRDFPARLQYKMNEPEEDKSRKVKFAPFLAVAGVFILIFFAWNIALNMIDYKKAVTPSKSLANEYEQLDTDIFLEEEILSDYLSDASNFESDTLAKEEIIDYLAYSDLDVYSDLEELGE